MIVGPVLGERERLDTLWDSTTGVMLRAGHSGGGGGGGGGGGEKTVKLHTTTFSKQSHTYIWVCCE